VCHEIDTDRCTRCFQQSIFSAKRAFGTVQASSLGSVLPPLARAARRTAPRLASRLAQTVATRAAIRVTAAEVSERLAAGREALASIDLIVAPSPSLADELLRLGAPADRIRISDYGFLPLGPGPQRKPGDSLRIGYVGTLVWHKGVHLAIEAMRHLPSTGCELKIFGDLATFPAYIADLRSRAAGLPVRFMGAFDRDQVSRVYAEIDVLVVPSLWLENSPLVIHEAFMAGVPVVGSRIGGIPNLVRDGWNGLLFEPASPDALARSMQRLIDDHGLLATLASRTAAVKSIEEDAREWEGRYDEVMVRGRSGA
jgi:glycosyltransferase involved in cell wall biosynthesis